jgi:GWxTD domain-containing protein
MPPSAVRSLPLPRLAFALAVCTLAACALAAFAPPAAAQVENQTAAAPSGRLQPFYVDALNFAQYDRFGLSSRLDVYVQVPFDLITFVRRGDRYAAAYTLTAVVSDEDGNRIKEESWTRRIERMSFESTVDPRFSDLSQVTLALDPGTVNLEIRFEDAESSKESRMSRTVTVRRFDPNRLSVSDVMLVGRVETVDGRRQISPQIDPNIASLSEGFHLFYEVYNPLELPAVDIVCRVLRHGAVVTESRERAVMHQGANSYLTRIGTAPFSVGSYTLQLDVRIPGDSSDAGLLMRGERQFMVEWISGGAPVAIADLDEAVEQLRYFASGEDLDRITEAPDEKTRRARFEEFWERHNPVPGSPVNRAMIEYYARITYANEHFRHYIDGWKTDRGMVYVIYGSPDAVDRHPLDVESKPYEVWEYTELNRRFVFVDETGFGDYRLLYPIWDDRNRMR